MGQLRWHSGGVNTEGFRKKPMEGRQKSLTWLNLYYTVMQHPFQQQTALANQIFKQIVLFNLLLFVFGIDWYSMLPILDTVLLIYTVYIQYVYIYMYMYMK